MTDDNDNNRTIRGVDSPPNLKTLTRVTESQIKRTGSNPEPLTAKPMNFSPPGQGQPAASTPTAPTPAAPVTTPGSGSSE